jgi:pantoate--beta-alanine ligase
MKTAATRFEAEDVIRGWRAAGDSIAFVPTMGNLHAGHVELLREARRRAKRVVASIFVNPIQFNDPDDFAAYPRTLEQDRALLTENRVDLLFVPAVGEMYPRGKMSARVEVPGLSGILCGAFRPGHFSGVATVVTMLFNIVRPDLALFGEKDYQQLLIIRRLVEDLCFAIQIIGIETVRDADGLALSSRNRYLSSSERARAPALYRSLCAVRSRIEAGERDYAKLESDCVGGLDLAGFRTEYVAIRRADDLEPPRPDDTRLRVLAAAWLGSARLIDNLKVDL